MVRKIKTSLLFFIFISNLLFGLSSCVIEIDPHYLNYKEKQRNRVPLRYLDKPELAVADPSKVYLITPQEINAIVQNSDFDTLKVYYGKIGCPVSTDYLKSYSNWGSNNLFIFGGIDDWAGIRFVDYKKYPKGVYKFVINDSISFNAFPNKTLAKVYDFYSIPYDSLNNSQLVLTYNKDKELIKVEK